MHSSASCTHSSEEGRTSGAPSSALHPYAGAPPCTRVTFSPMRKSPKNLPEGKAPLGTPLGGLLSSPQRRQAPLPPERRETPGSLQKPNLTAAPRIDSRGCDPRYSLRRNKDRFAHHLKVANRSVFVAQAHRGGAACRRGSEASPSGDSKGRSPWRAFGDFPRDGKVTRVQGGAPAGGCRDYQSRKSPR